MAPCAPADRGTGAISTRRFSARPFSLALVAIVAAGAAAAQQAQVTDPLPSIVKRGLSVEIKDVVRLPQTRGLRPADQDVTPAGWARISYVRDLPDGRRFVNDSRGFLYLLDPTNGRLTATSGWRRTQKKM